MRLNDDYILLLTKQFSGDISPEETTALSEWLALSPDNVRLASELRQAWDQSGSFDKVIHADLDTAFRQVQAKIRQSAPAPAKIVPMSRQILRIAATLLLLISGVWAYRQFTAPAPSNLIVGQTEKQLVTLPDGTRIWLRQNGAIEYPAQFAGAERRVKLSGEAYFEVSHDPAHPFIVDMANGDLVKVLGTEFGVRVSPGKTRTDVIVRSGKVFFSPRLQPEGIVLTARQKATFDRNGTNRLLVDKSASLNELAWQTGGLEFKSTPMQEVIDDLEAHYKVKITLQNPYMRTCPHTALHTTQPIEKVLESLALTHQFRVTNPAPGQYELLGGTCQ